MTPRGCRSGTSTTATPIRLNGIALKIVTGCNSDSNLPASTMKIKTSASIAAQRNSPSSLALNLFAAEPDAKTRGHVRGREDRERGLAGRRCRESPGAIRAVTCAMRRWSRRKISRAPATSSISATSPTATRRPALVDRHLEQLLGIGPRQLQDDLALFVAHRDRGRAQAFERSLDHGADVAKSTPNPRRGRASTKSASPEVRPRTTTARSRAPDLRETLAHALRARRRSSIESPAISTTIGGPPYRVRARARYCRSPTSFGAVVARPRATIFARPLAAHPAGGKAQPDSAVFSSV